MHLHSIGVNDSNLMCKLCDLDNKTPDHIVFDCGVLTGKRFKLFGAQVSNELLQDKLNSVLPLNDMGYI